MTPFYRVVIQWNAGIQRGAKRKFAAACRVTEVTAGRWMNKNQPPDEESRAEVAKVLGMTAAQLMTLFPGHDAQQNMVAESAPPYGQGDLARLEAKLDQVSQSIIVLARKLEEALDLKKGLLRSKRVGAAPKDADVELRRAPK